MIDDDDARDPDDALFLQAFDRLAGPPPDVRAGWADLTAGQPVPPRAARTTAGRPMTRQAPRVAVLAAVAVTATLVGYMARGGGDPFAPAAESSTSVEASASVPSAAPPTASPSSTARTRSSVQVVTVPAVASGPAAAGADTTVAPGSAEGGVDATAEPASTAPGAPAQAPSPSTRPAPTTAPAGTDATAAPPVVPVAPPATVASPRPVTVTGGVIEVPVIGGSFGVPNVVADPGWSYEIRKADPDRIEVRFRRGNQQLTVRLGLRSDGSISVEKN